MLQITGIKKEYRTGSLVQQALGGVSLSLRDSEFVAILGQSGSGKTTLLNIIGGLDRYDEGDLIINGVSTKKYRDRDWDSYRNHTVGFVFQSYNLIPHQSVLKNVELALTISGVSSKERTSRATEALEKVGLKDHIYKKPSQLSGGQMQRVAIARALVNDPDILLADEPTGALDSDTSLQVMDLLKEVASDRLVVMVTHNPELAEQYATRIVTLKDGLITSDSDPYEPEQGETVHRNLGKASMSFFTALALSFNNLWTKKARTILVAFAGSIGIIGIAMILSMSTGANQYIRSVEEESLQSYPLTITDSTFNLMSMYTNTLAKNEELEAKGKKDVSEWQTLTSIFSGVRTNDLKSLRAYFESDECDIYDHVQALEYDYNLTPQVFKEYGNDYRQVNPDTSLSALGLGGMEGSMNGLLSTMTNTDSFFCLPKDEALYKSAYDLKAGSWPKNRNECVLILTSSGSVSDMSLYIMGLKDPKELDEMIKDFIEGRTYEKDNPKTSYNYEDFLGVSFKYLSATQYYNYDKKYNVWSDRSSDKSYIKKLLKNAEELKIVGVVQPTENSNASAAVIGIGYSYSLLDHIIDMAADSDIVKAQMKNPEIDVFTGKRFDDKSSEQKMDLAELFTVDQSALQKAFNISADSFDLSQLDLSSMDLSSLDFSDIDMSSALGNLDLSELLPSISTEDLSGILGNIQLQITSDDMKNLFNEILQGYLTYAKDDPKADYKNLPSSVGTYLGTQETLDMLLEKLKNILSERSEYYITTDDLIALIQNVIAGYPDYLTAQGLTEEISYSYAYQYLTSDSAKALIDAEVTKLREKLKNLFTMDDVVAISKDLINGYEKYAADKDIPSLTYMVNAFTEYMATDSVKGLITKAAATAVDTSGIEKTIKGYTDKISTQLGSSLQKTMQKIVYAISQKVTTAMQSGMQKLMSGMSNNLMNAFNFDASKLSEMFKMNMSVEELKDLMVSLMTTQDNSYESNLNKLGYAEEDKPTQITIYPSDFESKNHIKQLISDYNDRMMQAGAEDKVIEYTDMVDALMGSVTVIVDVISYVLIAFVAISLIVSSIMIGVITYISVLERRKEIGILRAIGASKRNISQVFNAETFIIGTLAGVLGVLITELAIIPVNIIIHNLSGIDKINAVLPPLSALILILLSIALTLLGGLIPSRKAAKSDPVTALRSE